jgi:uncharacterized membrane protein YsdA (DUF1294 family)
MLRTAGTLLAIGFLGALAAGTSRGTVPLVILLGYATASLVAFAAVAVDKRRARTGCRRIPESMLHALELLGGWPGSLVGQRVAAHKTRKVRFQLVCWAIVLLHLSLWAVVLFG